MAGIRGRVAGEGILRPIGPTAVQFVVPTPLGAAACDRDAALAIITTSPSRSGRLRRRVGLDRLLGAGQQRPAPGPQAWEAWA